MATMYVRNIIIVHMISGDVQIYIAIDTNRCGKRKVIIGPAGRALSTQQAGKNACSSLTHSPHVRCPAAFHLGIHRYIHNTACMSIQRHWLKAATCWSQLISFLHHIFHTYIHALD